MIVLEHCEQQPASLMPCVVAAINGGLVSLDVKERQ